MAQRAKKGFKVDKNYIEALFGKETYFKKLKTDSEKADWIAEKASKETSDENRVAYSMMALMLDNKCEKAIRLLSLLRDQTSVN